MALPHDIAAWRLATEHGLPFPFRGHGWSMWPTLRPGDEALFAPLAAPPAPGDVLLYATDAALVAHRLVGSLPDGRLVLRGDAMGRADPPVEPAAVLGRLVAVRRGGRSRPPSRLWRLFALARPALRVVHALTPAKRHE
jgi:hypothetical protein